MNCLQSRILGSRASCSGTERRETPSLYNTTRVPRTFRKLDDAIVFHLLPVTMPFPPHSSISPLFVVVVVFFPPQLNFPFFRPQNSFFFPSALQNTLLYSLQTFGHTPSLLCVGIFSVLRVQL